MRKTENYARFISKSGTDELKMKFFVKNSSILNKIVYSAIDSHHFLFSTVFISFWRVHTLHLKIYVYMRRTRRNARERKRKKEYIAEISAGNLFLKRSAGGYRVPTSKNK